LNSSLTSSPPSGEVGSPSFSLMSTLFTASVYINGVVALSVSENRANSDTNDPETSFSELFSRICHYLYSGL
jgi:hypothetical protein